MSAGTYEIRAHWDPEAKVWWAESDDVPGFAAETETVEEMVESARTLVPELLKLNGHPSADQEVTLSVIADREERLRIKPAA